MYDRDIPKQWVDSTLQSNEPRYAVVGPATGVLEISEDERCGVFLRHDGQDKKDSNESTNMNDS